MGRKESNEAKSGSILNCVCALSRCLENAQTIEHMQFCTGSIFFTFLWQRANKHKPTIELNSFGPDKARRLKMYSARIVAVCSVFCTVCLLISVVFLLEDYFMHTI